MDYNIEITRDKSYKEPNDRLNLLDNSSNELGYAVLRKDPAKRENTMALSEIYIKPEHRGKGLTSVLMSKIKDKYKDNNIVLRALPYKDKPLDRDKLKEMYKKYGFEPIEGKSKKEKGSNDIMMYKVACYKEEIFKLAVNNQERIGQTVGLTSTWRMLNMLEDEAIKQIGKRVRIPENLTESQAREIAEDYISKNKLNARFVSGKPFYQNKKITELAKKISELKKKINLPYKEINNIEKSIVSSIPNEEALRHELGHAKDLERNPLLKKFSRKTMALAPLLGISDKLRNELKETEVFYGPTRFYEKNPITASIGLSLIPNLMTEGKASAIAAKELVKAHGLKEGLKKSRTLIAPFGTYVPGAITRGAIMGMLAKIWMNKEEK